MVNTESDLRECQSQVVSEEVKLSGKPAPTPLQYSNWRYILSEYKVISSYRFKIAAFFCSPVVSPLTVDKAEASRKATDSKPKKWLSYLRKGSSPNKNPVQEETVIPPYDPIKDHLRTVFVFRYKGIKVDETPYDSESSTYSYLMISFQTLIHLLGEDKAIRLVEAYQQDETEQRDKGFEYLRSMSQYLMQFIRLKYVQAGKKKGVYSLQFPPSDSIERIGKDS